MLLLVSCAPLGLPQDLARLPFASLNMRSSKQRPTSARSRSHRLVRLAPSLTLRRSSNRSRLQGSDHWRRWRPRESNVGALQSTHCWHDSSVRASETPLWRQAQSPPTSLPQPSSQRFPNRAIDERVCSLRVSPQSRASLRGTPARPEAHGATQLQPPAAHEPHNAHVCRARDVLLTTHRSLGFGFALDSTAIAAPERRTDDQRDADSFGFSTLVRTIHQAAGCSNRRRYGQWGRCGTIQ
jgi:hypothetical protein